MSYVYLDHNATTPLSDKAREALVQALSLYGNPSSVHQHGREARHALDTARRQVAEVLGVRSEQIVFTSGGSEANNLVLRGVADSHDKPLIVVNPTEHPCVRNTAKDLADQGKIRLRWLHVDHNGVVDRADVKAALAEKPVMLSLMAANNETGVIQPVAEVAALCREANVWLHVDAVQAFGKIPVNMDAMGADFLTLSSHKHGGPKGVGVLAIRGNPQLQAQITGGAQERNRRAGTENLPSIVAAGVAVADIQSRLADMPRLQQLQQHMEQQLKKGVPGLKVVGEDAPRVANTSYVVTPGVTSEMLMMALDMAGFAVSSGSACSSGRIVPSKVLLAQGYSEDEALCAIRISSSVLTTADEVDAFCTAFVEAATRLQGKAAS